MTILFIILGLALLALVIFLIIKYGSLSDIIEIIINVIIYIVLLPIKIVFAGLGGDSGGAGASDDW